MQNNTMGSNIICAIICSNNIAGTIAYKYILFQVYSCKYTA
jgi:hypothetical protein